MPGFDVDFCMDGRDRVIDHVAETLWSWWRYQKLLPLVPAGQSGNSRCRSRIRPSLMACVDRISKMIPPDPGMVL